MHMGAQPGSAGAPSESSRNGERAEFNWTEWALNVTDLYCKRVTTTYLYIFIQMPYLLFNP